MNRVILTGIILATLIGCTRGRPSQKPPIHLVTNMDVQPRVERQSASTFYADGAGMRLPVEGTLARGQLRDDSEYYTGRNASGKLIQKSPLPYTLATLQRGQERYGIFCEPCHGPVGDARTMVIRRGFIPPPSNLLDERLRTIEDGHLFDVISNGIRVMPSYSSQIPVADRWAIVAYLRALQRSQNADINDIPEKERGLFQQ